MHQRSRVLRIGLTALLLVSASGDGRAGEPAKDLKDKDFMVRLAAVDRIRRDGAPDAEALLLGALEDRDAEVVERAAAALADRGTEASVPALVALALHGPVRRVRLAASRSVARLGADAACEAFGKKTGGDDAERAYEAIAVIAPAVQGDLATKLVERGLKADGKPSSRMEPDRVRVAAARGLIAFPPAVRAGRIEQLVNDPDLSVAAAAIATVIDHPDPVCLPAMVAGLSTPKLNDVIERRLAWAIRAIVESQEGEERAKLAQVALEQVGGAGTPEAQARFARLAGVLGTAPPEPEPVEPPVDGAPPAPPAEPVVPPLVAADVAMDALLPALTSSDANVRGAATAALARIRSERSLNRAVELTRVDTDARVRLLAVRVLAATRTARDTDTFKVFVERLADDDQGVREAAAVALGLRGVQGAVPSLEKLVDEAMAQKNASKWALGTVALVSLGKTRDPAAVPVLQKAWSEAKDWRLRASAVVGLGHVEQKEAVDTLIEALDSKEPSARTTAFEFLRRMTPKDNGTAGAKWRAWWRENQANYEFVDREAEAKKAKKYGYAPTDVGVYEGLDVVVLATRGGGDRIEDLLTELGVEHRLTRQPQVTEAGLHPFALFVANCPGEIGDKDVEAIAWFIKAGGSMFASCWALEKTIERVCPGVVKRYLTPGAQVLDYDVIAEQCPTESPFLEGVFDGVTRPMYVLEGAHLLQIVDPDRCEVLIDSPDSATAWGSGNMASWFTVGHGVVLDSVNHFNHQGFHFAPSLKTDEDRIGFAMDHMGVSYSEVRDLAARKVWGSKTECAKHVHDLAAFRFLSNFVRHKRKVDA